MIPDWIARRIEIDDRTGCWLWTGSIAWNGYGCVRVAAATSRTAHRAVYQALLGPIPHGLDLDHACHNKDLRCPGGTECRHRRCVNPAHLVACTRSENLKSSGRVGGFWRSKTHCRNGHEYTPENTYQRPDRSGRACRVCLADAARRYEGRRKARRNAA